MYSFTISSPSMSGKVSVSRNEGIGKNNSEGARVSGGGGTVPQLRLSLMQAERKNRMSANEVCACRRLMPTSRQRS